ncbi:MAG: MFS transporter [Acidobacteriota bacterium]|nr:MFS transporter [Acidobacteriota bacterium]
MKIPKLQWVIAAMLFLATAINYTDRGALSIVSTDIRQEFHMTEQDYSWVLFFFMLAYAIMYAGSGYIVDRLGTKRGFAVFIAFWSCAAMLHGFARGFWSLVLCRFLLGLGEPGNWPAAAKAVGEWFPARQRALGVGIFNAGSSLGSALAGPVIASLTLVFGWRVAFVFTGVIGLAWLGAWLILYDPPHKNRWLRAGEYASLKDHVEPPEQTRAASAQSVDWRKVIRMRECYTLILARFFTDPVIYFVIFWLPEYLHKERGFNLAMIGRYGWIPFLFGGIGYVVGGWLSGRLIRAGWNLPAARKAVMAMGAAVMPIAIFAPHAPNAAMAIGATCFLTLGHAFFTCNAQALPTDLFKGQEVGTATGFSGMGGAIGGMIANLGTGYLVQHFSYSPVFLLAGLMHPLAVTLVYAMLPARRLHVIEVRGVAGTLR